MVGQVIANRYELEELAGTGGMSSVYRAHDTLLERNVALKILHDRHSRDDDYVERFRREAQTVARLSHPNIVSVIDRGQADGRQYIVFEYVDGETLDQLVGRRGALPVEEALRIAIRSRPWPRVRARARPRPSRREAAQHPRQRRTARRR